MIFIPLSRSLLAPVPITQLIPECVLSSGWNAYLLNPSSVGYSEIQLKCHLFREASLTAPLHMHNIVGQGYFCSYPGAFGILLHRKQLSASASVSAMSQILLSTKVEIKFSQLNSSLGHINKLARVWSRGTNTSLTPQGGAPYGARS